MALWQILAFKGPCFDLCGRVPRLGKFTHPYTNRPQGFPAYNSVQTYNQLSDVNPPGYFQTTTV